MHHHWARLQGVASEVVEATWASLPPPLRARAEALPVTLEPRPSAELCGEGIEPDTLGLFVGTEFGAEETEPWPVPAQIILFLENLWDAAEADPQQFQDEVRTTLLHELGHYLGLDEDDLVDRGLE